MSAYVCALKKNQYIGVSNVKLEFKIKNKLSHCIFELGMPECSLGLGLANIRTRAPNAVGVTLDKASIHHVLENPCCFVFSILHALDFSQLLLEMIDGLELVLNGLLLRHGFQLLLLDLSLSASPLGAHLAEMSTGAAIL